MDKINIGFLGYGTRALDALMEHPDFQVKYFFAPQSRLCEDVYVAHEKYPDPEFVIVKNNDELYDALLTRRDVSCFLINACPIILKPRVLDIMPFFNIHPGDLRTNRGHQPHMWTVLLGEKTSSIAVHTVTPGIDEGTVIRSKTIGISPEDNSNTVLNKLEDEIPFLLDGLRDYLINGAEPECEIYSGIYRPIMTYSDYELDLSKLCESGFLDDALRKIRARYIKHGAFFRHHSSRVYVDDIISVKGTPAVTDSPVRRIFSNNLPGTVTVQRGNYSITFHINHIEPID